MPPDVPPELAAVLDGPDPAARTAAWSALLDRYSRLLLKAATGLGGGYDDRMDRYRHVIEQLQADDYRRLRSYQVQARGSFAAWLLVVAKRLSLDFERGREGRSGRARPGSRADDARRIRGRLLRLAGAGVEPDELASQSPDAEHQVRRAELLAALDAVMRSLPPRDRLLLTFRFEDGASVRDIAEVLGYQNVFQVYHRLRQLLREVREALVARGFDGPAP